MFLPRWGFSVTDARLGVDRNVAHVVAGEVEVLDGLLVRVADLGVVVLGPLVVDQQDGSGAQRVLVDAAVEHLLVEGHHQVRLVAHVAYGLRAEADADAAGAGAGARRGLDLGRDDLHGPQAVAHLGADGAEQLARRLRSLAGVAHDLDDLLRDGPDLDLAFSGVGIVGGGLGFGASGRYFRHGQRLTLGTMKFPD